MCRQVHCGTCSFLSSQPKSRLTMFISPQHTLTGTHSHSYTHSHAHTFPITCITRHTLILSRTHIYTHSHTLIHKHKFSHTLTHTHIHTLRFTHAYTFPFTHTHSLPFTCTRYCNWSRVKVIRYHLTNFEQHRYSAFLTYSLYSGLRFMLQ